MSTLRIYMIDPELPGSARYMFLDREDFKPELYQMVYEGAEDELELEGLFCKYNRRERLQSLGIRSLSVSDVVVFESKLGVKEGHICRSIGWKELSQDQIKQLEENRIGEVSYV